MGTECTQAVMETAFSAILCRSVSTLTTGSVPDIAVLETEVWSVH